MRTVHNVLKTALEQEGVENASAVARKAIKRMRAHPEVFIGWLSQLGVLRFVGYTSRRVPRRIREVPLTRDECHVYVTHCEVE